MMAVNAPPLSDTSRAGALGQHIAAFDDVLAAYMTGCFGIGWRTMCHQSAKIAVAALKETVGGEVRIRRMELVALMADGTAFVHIGDPGDPAEPGKIPLHFGVQGGNALYDPTFGQLCQSRTLLDLPDEPFFFSENFFSSDALADAQGFRWSAQQRPTGILRVAYKVQPAPIPVHIAENLMTDAVAALHAKAIVAAWTSTLRCTPHVPSSWGGHE